MEPELLCEVGSKVNVLRECDGTVVIGCRDRCVTLDSSLAADSLAVSAEVVDCLLMEDRSLALLLSDDSVLFRGTPLRLPGRGVRIFGFDHGLAVCLSCGAVVFFAESSSPSWQSLEAMPQDDLTACFSSQGRLTILVQPPSKNGLLAFHWDWRYGTPPDTGLLAREAASTTALDGFEEAVDFALPATTDYDPSLSMVLILRAKEGSTKFVKLSGAGRTLLSVSLERTPSAARTVSLGLVLLVGGNIQLFDLRYGCCLLSEDIPALSPKSILSLSQCELNGDTFLLVLSTKTKGKGTTLHRSYISVLNKDSEGTLRKALGCKFQPPNVEPSKEENYRVFDGLQEPLKRKLEQAQQKLFDFIKRKDLESSEQEVVVARYTKLPRIYIDVPAEAVEQFLHRFSAALPEEILPSDWNIVKTLLRSSVISAEGPPEIITRAMAAGRADVLCYVLQFAPDLKENTALFILCSASGVSDEHLSCLVHMNGELHWRRRPNDTKKSRGRRKGASDPSKTEEDVIFDDDAWQPCASHLELLRLMCEAAVRRSAAFSRTLLAEAFVGLSRPATNLLLRVFAILLRGLTSPCSTSIHLGPFTDVQVTRAVDWIEAALDAHFSAMAFSISVSEVETVRAVKNALTAVGSISIAIEDMEGVIGLWEHIRRSSKLGIRYDGSHDEVYSVDRFSFK